MTHPRASGQDRLKGAVARMRAASRTRAASRSIPLTSPPTGSGQAPAQAPGAPLKVEPYNAFEVAIAEQLKHIRSDVDRLQARLNWLFALIVGAAASNVLLSLLS